MVRQHEEERRRLSRELHDETAQVFTAVKMQLGVLRADVEPARRERLDRVLGLIDTGIRSIRSVTNDLRPSLLDDLGLLPALRSLCADFEERSGIAHDARRARRRSRRSPTTPTSRCSARCRKGCPTSRATPARARRTSPCAPSARRRRRSC